MNKSYELPLTEEEIEAISEYSTGITHAKINFIADLDYDKQQELKKDNWNVEMTTEELEKNIKTFVNLYSAIYKVGTREPRKGLYRATNKGQIQENTRKGKIASFTSTSLEKEYANSKFFAGYAEDAVILRINVEENVPTLYTEPYKKDTYKDEEEILIAPFTEVKQISERERWEGYAYYDVTLEKEELEEVPQKELRALQAQLIEGYDYYKEQVKVSMALESKINDLERQMKKDEGEEVQKLKKADLIEVSKQYIHAIKTVQEYQKQFKRMIRGLCKQKELEIERQREEKRIREIEQRKIRDEEHLKQLETEITNLKQQVQNGKTNIIEMLEQYIGEVEETSQKYQAIAEDLKIGYSQNVHFRVLEMIENIKTKLKTREEKNENTQEIQEESEDYKVQRDRLQDLYGDLLKQKHIITEIQQSMQEIPQYIQKHKKQSFQEVKANLNKKVQEMITKARVTHLQTEKQQVLQEKESRLQRIFYGTTIKDEKLANIEAKIELERKQALARNPENSVGVMMANLYDCSAQDLNGEFQPEMLETIYAIRRNFDKLPNEKVLADQAYQKVSGNYPTILGEKRISKRKQIDYYRQDTDKIKFEMYDNIHHKNPIHQEVDINALSKFEGTISKIEMKLKEGKDVERGSNLVGRDIA